MWGKIIIPMYRLWLHSLYGLYGPQCPLSPKRLINLNFLSSLKESWFDHNFTSGFGGISLCLVSSLYMYMSLSVVVNSQMILIDLLYKFFMKVMHHWCTQTRPQDEVSSHYDVITGKCFLHYWPFVRGIHLWLVNSPHKKATIEYLMISLLIAWGWSWTNSQVCWWFGTPRGNSNVMVMPAKIR